MNSRRIIVGVLGSLVLAIDSLARLIRRRGDVDDQMSVSNKGLQLGWAAGIPDVLTDVQPDSRAAHRKNRTARAALKVLVETPLQQPVLCG